MPGSSANVISEAASKIIKNRWEAYVYIYIYDYHILHTHIFESVQLHQLSRSRNHHGFRTDPRSGSLLWPRPSRHPSRTPSSRLQSKRTTKQTNKNRRTPTTYELQPLTDIIHHQCTSDDACKKPCKVPAVHARGVHVTPSQAIIEEARRRFGDSHCVSGACECAVRSRLHSDASIPYVRAADVTR